EIGAAASHSCIGAERHAAASGSAFPQKGLDVPVGPRLLGGDEARIVGREAFLLDVEQVALVVVDLVEIAEGGMARDQLFNQGNLRERKKPVIYAIDV